MANVPLLQIYAETPLLFDIQCGTEGFVLKLDGGEWRLWQNAEGKFVAMGRVEWPKALARALEMISDNNLSFGPGQL